MAQIEGEPKTMNDSIKIQKIDRKLPPHELNARRARKRAVTQLPAIASLPAAPKSVVVRNRQPQNNLHNFNPASNPNTDHTA
jgi:hypothetical protein